MTCWNLLNSEDFVEQMENESELGIGGDTLEWVEWTQELITVQNMPCTGMHKLGGDVWAVATRLVATDVPSRLSPLFLSFSPFAALSSCTALCAVV